MIEAGAAVVVVTPPLGAKLAGAFEIRPSATIERDLTVRALVLKNETERIALVVCDVVCVPRQIVQAARSLIVSATGIPPENVLISATHTHSAPAPAALLSTPPDEQFVCALPRHIADAVAIAYRRARPATLAHGSADTYNVCFNRRYRMKDGTVRFNPGVGNPDIVEVTGPTDPAVTAMLVEDLDGNAIALWACLSLHYVGVADQFAMSPDYYGDYAESVSQWLGNDCIGLLTNGTSGQINNVDIRPHEVIPAAEQRRRVGNAVAATAVQATVLRPRMHDLHLASTLLPFEVKRRGITKRDIALAHDILKGRDIGDTQFDYVVGMPVPEGVIRQYASEAIELATWPTSLETDLQVMQVGDVAIVGMPGEMFVEHGLALKSVSPFATTAVVGLANDYVGYIPTTAAFGEGAYETWAAKSAWAAPGTGEHMVDTVIRHWNGTDSG